MINVTVAGNRPVPRMAAYSASKSALVSLTLAVAKELPNGKVLCVCPCRGGWTPRCASRSTGPTTPQRQLDPMRVADVVVELATARTLNRRAGSFPARPSSSRRRGAQRSSNGRSMSAAKRVFSSRTPRSACKQTGFETSDHGSGESSVGRSANGLRVCGEARGVQAFLSLGALPLGNALDPGERDRFRTSVSAHDGRLRGVPPHPDRRTRPGSRRSRTSTELLLRAHGRDPRSPLRRPRPRNGPRGQTEPGLGLLRHRRRRRSPPTTVGIRERAPDARIGGVEPSPRNSGDRPEPGRSHE